jgi:hypothetical protein
MCNFLMTPMNKWPEFVRKGNKGMPQGVICPCQGLNPMDQFCNFPKSKTGSEHVVDTRQWQQLCLYKCKPNKSKRPEVEYDQENLVEV